MLLDHRRRILAYSIKPFMRDDIPCQRSYRCCSLVRDDCDRSEEEDVANELVRCRTATDNAPCGSMHLMTFLNQCPQQSMRSPEYLISSGYERFSTVVHADTSVKTNEMTSIVWHRNTKERGLDSWKKTVESQLHLVTAMRARDESS